MRRDRWPNALVTDLENRYFKEASAQIGVDETNDFLYGPLQNALRQQLFDEITGRRVRNAMVPNVLPDHPAVPFTAQPPIASVLSTRLRLPLGGPIHKRPLLCTL